MSYLAPFRHNTTVADDEQTDRQPDRRQRVP